jgi:glutathione S-transferase
MAHELSLYHAPASPNFRRVRIFLTEKSIAVPADRVAVRRGHDRIAAWPSMTELPIIQIIDGVRQ